MLSRAKNHGSSQLNTVTQGQLVRLSLFQIQGALIAASLFEVILGVSGLIGILLRYIGPLAIAPTVSLVGLALFRPAASFAAKNWYIALA